MKRVNISMISLATIDIIKDIINDMSYQVRHRKDKCSLSRAVLILRGLDDNSQSGNIKRNKVI